MERAQIKEQPKNDEKLNREMMLLSLRELLPSLSVQLDARIEKRIGKDKLQEISEDVAGVLAVGAPQGLTRNERLALTVRVLRCLAHYIEKDMQLPVTINTIVTHIPVLEHAVDRAFPGYIRSGLLRYAILPPRSAA